MTDINPRSPSVAAYDARREPLTEIKKTALLREVTAVKYAWHRVQLRSYRVSALREVLEVNLSGYCSCKHVGTPKRKRLTDIQLMTLIQSLHAEVVLVRGDPDRGE